MDNKGSEFSNRSNKPWLQDNDTEIYSTHKEGKSAVGKRFIATLKKYLQMCDFDITNICILIN